MTSFLVLPLLEHKVRTLASPLCCSDSCLGGCPPSVILSTPQAAAPVAWRGGLPRPPPSRAAASIPPSLSHWTGEWVPSPLFPLLRLPSFSPSIHSRQLRRGGYLAERVSVQGHGGPVNDSPPRGAG